MNSTVKKRDIVTQINTARINSVGTFAYDALTNKSTYDGIDRLIMGLPEGDADYETVLKCVDVKSRTMFDELVNGGRSKQNVVTFPEIVLANGNVVIDRHFREFDQDGNLLRLQGFTKLVRVA